MSKNRNSWQAIHQEILDRIRTQIWSPGELIPNEVELAEEFGCARATINRALRAAAESGLLERKRKAGTRVTAQPAHKAILRIPVLRREIESAGKTYSHELRSIKIRIPPAKITSHMRMQKEQTGLHLTALHFANGQPFVYEDRWINTKTIPSANPDCFRETNANEWLLTNAPFTRGDVEFSAKNATKQLGNILRVKESQALFNVTRTTWRDKDSITFVNLAYAPGYVVKIEI